MVEFRIQALITKIILSLQVLLNIIEDNKVRTFYAQHNDQSAKPILLNCTEISRLADITSNHVTLVVNLTIHSQSCLALWNQQSNGGFYIKKKDTIFINREVTTLNAKGWLNKKDICSASSKLNPVEKARWGTTKRISFNMY